jgi:hypothetical protein
MSTEFRSPEILRIEELVRRVKDGDIKLPKFQRPFVWKRGDVLTLWDSVYRGYPIGSVLLWLTKQRLASEREIGELDVSPRAEEYPTNYLLDGQQRLSSLCGVLYWPGGDPKSIWNVAFDLRAEEFFHATGTLEPWQFPLKNLLETRDFLNQCAKFQNENDQATLNANAQRLLSAVKDYKIAAVVLADMDLQKVGPVFERINSKGRRLTIVDLMRAATWSDSFDINELLERIDSALKEADYTDTDTKAVLRNVSAACGKGITVEGIEKLKELQEDELRTACSAVETAYRAAVDFLKKDVGVPSDYLLPYRLQLTLLAEFFRRCPTPFAAQRRGLEKWFWRSALTSYFKASNSKQMQSDLSAITSFAEDPSFNLVETVPCTLDATFFVDSEFNINGASGKAFALMLATKSPRGLLDGSVIDTGIALVKANRVEFHHLFPRAFLAGRGVERGRQNCLANICMTNLVGNRRFTDQAPSAYLTAAQSKWGDQADIICSSNFIGELAWLYAMENDFESFCMARAYDLAACAAELTAAEPTAKRLPALA